MSRLLHALWNLSCLLVISQILTLTVMQHLSYRLQSHFLTPKADIVLSKMICKHMQNENPKCPLSCGWNDSSCHSQESRATDLVFLIPIPSWTRVDSEVPFWLRAWGRSPGVIHSYLCYAFGVVDRRVQERSYKVRRRQKVRDSWRKWQVPLFLFYYKLIYTHK